jgi:hypothetical protein
MGMSRDVAGKRAMAADIDLRRMPDVMALEECVKERAFMMA